MRVIDHADSAGVAPEEAKGREFRTIEIATGVNRTRYESP